MPDVQMQVRVVPPGTLTKLTGRLSRLPDHDWMTHARADGEALEVVQQIIEETCSGQREGELRMHTVVRNPHPYPVHWDMLAVEL
jgi:hypothetical protein